MFSNMFWIRGEKSVYFNIKEEKNIIQTSLRRGEGNLLYKLQWEANIVVALILTVLEILSSNVTNRDNNKKVEW